MSNEDPSNKVLSFQEAQEARRRRQEEARMRFLDGFLRIWVEAGNRLDVDEPPLVMPPDPERPDEER